MKIAQIMMSQAWGKIDLDSPSKGLGGRETAMVRLGEQWAKMGHEVHCFVPCEDSTRKEYEAGFGANVGSLSFIPVELARPVMGAFPYDAAVAWECPSVFGDEKVRENVPVRVTEMQVAHFTGREMEDAERYCQSVFALSQWHAEFLQHSGYSGRIDVLPNGVDIERYPNRDFVKGHKSPTFVYSSSPDRGLNHLLATWPIIRERFPDATLYVGYGAGSFANQYKWGHNRMAEMCVDISEGLKQAGVIDLGKIGQDKLAKLQEKATMWLYPCDPINATETGCITAVENAAACNPMVISDADCLPSEFGEIAIVSPLPFDGAQYADLIEEVLGNPAKYESMARKGREFAEARDWSLIAPQWVKTFKTLA